MDLDALLRLLNGAWIQIIERLGFSGRKKYIKKPDEFWFRVNFTDETRAKHKTSRERYWVEGEFKPGPAEQDRWGESRLV